MICSDGSRKYAGGYLTVYAALSLSVLLSLFLTLLEGIRLHTFQLEAKLIADIATDSVLAEYHREMLDQYGMFWMDISYGTKNPSIQNLEEHLEGYLAKNCGEREVFGEEYLYRDFLRMKEEGALITKVAVATDGGGSFFRERAVEAIESDVGLTLLEEVAGWIDTVERHDLLESSLEEEKQIADSQISELNGQEKQIGDDWITLEVENPTVPIEKIKSKGILALVMEEPGKVSTNGVDTDFLISGRHSRGEINQGNWELPVPENLMERLLWQEYLLQYCGFWGQEKEGSVLRYQVEYLIAGKNNDTENLKGVVHRISAVREAANAIYLFADETKSAEAEAAASLVSAVVLLPQLQPLFKTAIMLGWAYAESLYDVKCLLEGKKVPLLKTDESWHYDIDTFLGKTGQTDQGVQGSGIGEKYDSEGLAYADYLRLLLVLSSLEMQTLRMMDIAEMDIRQTPGNASFRLDGCVDRYEADISVRSGYGYELIIKKSKKY